MVAQTILAQLGGKRFLVMTGAKSLVDTGSGLQFSLPRYAGLKINKVRITLDASDTYTIEFGRYAKMEYKAIETIEGVYCDQLQEIFESHTGLATSL